jgi:hypothetical protein
MTPDSLALTRDKRNVEPPLVAPGSGGGTPNPDLADTCRSRSDPMARTMPAAPAGRLGISAQPIPKSAVNRRSAFSARPWAPPPEAVGDPERVASAWLSQFVTRANLGPLAKLMADIQFSGECWLWTARVTGAGYGTFMYGRRHYRVHRFACEVTHGRLAPRMMACHLCENKRCCSPCHIVPGTARENWQDCLANGGHCISSTARRGASHGYAKFTEEQVLTILERRRSGETYTSISQAYDVPHQTIRSMCTGRSWSSFTGIRRVDPSTWAIPASELPANV